MQEKVNLWRQCARAAMSAVLPRSLFMTRGPTNGQAVYLTFDDGPHPEHTPRLLDVMAEHAVKGTFFLLGKEAEQHSRIVERIASEGHGIGNHTWSHLDLRKATDAAMIEEVTKTNRLVAEITGRTPTLFRPPFGKVTARKLWTLWRMRMTVTLWNVDTKDYSGRDGQSGRKGQATSQQLRDWKPVAGDVVLMHDVNPQITETLATLLGMVRSRQPSLRFSPLCGS